MDVEDHSGGRVPDTNRVQYQLLKTLCNKGVPLCVVGDDDQSIYRWRGARVENILDFPLVFPDAKVVTSTGITEVPE